MAKPSFAMSLYGVVGLTVAASSFFIIRWNYGGNEILQALEIVLLEGSGAERYLAWVGAASLSALTLYFIDKRSAVGGDLRVPEALLHLLAAVGGFPGGWAGMIFFRHKTRKTSFKVVLTVATLAHVGVWARIFWFY